MNYHPLQRVIFTRHSAIGTSIIICLATVASAFVIPSQPPKRFTSVMASNPLPPAPNNGDKSFANFSSSGEIPTFDGDEKAKATDFANYFCAYSQLYHQKQMLTDHNRMAAYHAAIVVSSSFLQCMIFMTFNLWNPS